MAATLVLPVQNASGVQTRQTSLTCLLCSKSCVIDTITPDVVRRAAEMFEGHRCARRW